VGQIINVVAGLATTLIGYVIGRLWQRVADQIPYRRARIFWQPLFSSQVQVVVSCFEPPGYIEPTGLVGGGDAIALREISAYLSRIGDRRHKVVYVDEPTLDRKNNLILLGGPGTNAVTKDALQLIGARLQVVDTLGLPPEIRDTAPAEGHASSRTAAKIPRAYVPSADADYGMIVRARNPFNPEKWLVIFAGAFGYGTWGGVELALGDDAFLQQCRELQQKNGIPARNWIRRIAHLNRGGGLGGEPVQMECLFKFQVYDRRPFGHESIVGPRLLPSRKAPH
jgi:hypothetical protein